MTAAGARPYTQFSRLTGVELGSCGANSVRFVSVTLVTAGSGHSAPPSQTSVLVSSDVFTIVGSVSIGFVCVSLLGNCSVCGVSVLIVSVGGGCAPLGSVVVSSVDVTSA